MKKKNINIISTKSNTPWSIEILAKDISNYLNNEKEFNINLIELKQYAHLNNTLSLILKGLDLFVLQMKFFLFSGRYKWINIFPSDILIPVFFTMINKNKNIFIHHHFDYLPTDQLRKTILKQKYFVCDTEFWKKELLSFFKLNKVEILPNNIKVIPLATQLDNHKLHWISINKDEKYILYVGSEVSRKNIPQLIEVFANLKKTYPDLKFIKCWPEKENESIIPKLVKSYWLNIDDYVIFSDITKSDLSYLYKHASCFVSCSRLEWFGMPIAEAMSVWCPLVVSDISPFRELLGDEWIFCSYYNTNEFVIQTDNLIKDFDFRKRHITYIKRRFNEKLSLAIIIKHWKNILLKI